MDDAPSLESDSASGILENDSFLHHITRFLEVLESQHLDTAKANLDNLVSCAPSAVLSYYCSGLLLLALQEPAKAVSILKKAVDDAKDGEIYYEMVEALAIVCARLGRQADALYYGKLAPSFLPHPTIPNLLPTWLGKFEKALLGKHTLKATTHDWFLHGQHERAISCLVDLLAFDPHHGETWEELIRFLEKEERHADVIACCLALKDIRPLKEAEICLFAFALGKNGQLAEAFHYVSHLIEDRYPAALRVHHLLFTEIGMAGFEHLQLPVPQALTTDTPSKFSSKFFSKRPFTIALAASNWHPFRLTSLVAPLFYLPRYEFCQQNDIRVVLVDLSLQKTLHLSFLKNRFGTVIQGATDTQPIDSHTLTTILHHSAIDLLIDLDGVASTHFSLYHHRNPAPAPVIAPLIRSCYGFHANNHVHPLTDTIIHPHAASEDTAFAPLDNHSLFCLDNEQAITKAALPPFPLTVGLFAAPCHLHSLHPLFDLLQKLDARLCPIRILFYTPKAGGIPATTIIAESLPLKRAEVAFSAPNVTVMDFCSSCHVIIDAVPTITDCYPYAALRQSVPVLHLALPQEPAIIPSLLHAFHRSEWSFSNPDDLVAFLGIWQENPSDHDRERERFFQQHRKLANTASLCQKHLYHIANTYQNICTCP